MPKNSNLSSLTNQDILSISTSIGISNSVPTSIIFKILLDKNIISKDELKDYLDYYLKSENFDSSAQPILDAAWGKLKESAKNAK